MKKTITVTLLCASLMLITPFTTVAKENTVSNSLPEQPNDVEGLVAQLRVVINEILQDYGHIPIVRNLGNHILEILDSNVHRAICILLLIVLLPIICLLILLAWIFRDSAEYIMLIVILIAGNWDLYCVQYLPLKSKSPLKPISSLIDTNDISNLVDECPCMQQ